MANHAPPANPLHGNCASISTMWALGRIVAGLALAAAAAGAQDTLDIYFVDVEGGQATLIRAPSGESLLVDAGWPGFNSLDADRIAGAAKQAGIAQIDYLVVTHYHTDHVGGVPELVEMLPVVHFVDHGPNLEDSQGAKDLYARYVAVREKGKHIQVKPGNTIPIKGVEVKIVAAAGELIGKPSGARTANPLCASAERREDDPSENARSVGMVIGFGKFRLVNLGDLTWNKELDLFCPDNRLGTVDVYLTTHHGMNMSGPVAAVHALRARVAVMNNGAKKGGSPDAWRIVRDSPGLEDIWQLHFALAGGSEHNAPEKLIANLGENDMGDWIKISARRDGSFSVTNSRNGFTKNYAAR